jgi:hypothetical protein
LSLADLAAKPKPAKPHKAKHERRVVMAMV